MNNEMQDITIVCCDCGTEFPWTVSRQQFYAEKDFAKPKRCRVCANERRASFDNKPERPARPENSRSYREKNHKTLYNDGEMLCREVKTE